MNILFLTQIIPYPPDAGPKVKTWNVLRYLCEKGHNVTLASFVRPEEMPYIDALKQLCSKVYTVPIRRSRINDAGFWLRSNFSGRPFLIERDDILSMQTLVDQLVRTESVEVVHSDQFTMTQFALPLLDLGNQRPCIIFDAHNAVWTIVKRMQQNAPWFLKPLAAMETNRVKLYEGRLVREFDYTLAVTEPDRVYLLQAAAEAEIHSESSSFSAINRAQNRVNVIPIAVDTDLLKPVRRQPGSANILALGTLSYPPNADGIRWFAREVFPLIRRENSAATLTIIGKKPPNDFLRLAEQYPETIKVTGFIPDLTPFLEQAALMVIPVRAGSGMRVRILEAFARGIPVVTTTIGLEGIEAQVGRDVLVEDSPSEFATTVSNLLNDEALQKLLTANGRHLAESCYDWRVVLQKLDAIYKEIEEVK
jgi:polysaccharide biosynthesis protein PslH